MQKTSISRSVDEKAVSLQLIHIQASSSQKKEASSLFITLISTSVKRHVSFYAY